MADLRDIAESLGYTAVRTYLRSGNLVFTTPERTPRAVATKLEQAIEARLGMAVGVIVRGADELTSIVAADPLKGSADDGSRKHVVFLAEPLSADVHDWLSSTDFRPDTVRPAEREVYVWYEGGMSGSTTAERIAKRLPGTATDRNWNTVTRLMLMATELP